MVWYINFSGNDLVKYYTYHGTKGLEYDNVVIIMENKFGRVKNYYNTFFRYFMNLNQLKGKELENFKEVKNLLYVAISRAIKILRAFYVDSIDEFRNEIKYIFEEPINFTKGTQY